MVSPLRRAKQYTEKLLTLKIFMSNIQLYIFYISSNFRFKIRKYFESQEDFFAKAFFYIYLYRPSLIMVA